MTALYDLQVTIRRAYAGCVPVHLRLERREPYPPQPARRGDELVLRDRAETVGRAQTELDETLLEAARLPAELADVVVLGDPQRRQLLSSGWMLEALLPPMAALAEAMFVGRGAGLLEEMHHAIAGSRLTYPWSPPDAVGRISLKVSDATLWRVPWELLLAGPACPGELGQSCVVVRRERERAGTRTAALTLPLTVSIYKAAAELRDAQGWGDGLFAGNVGGYAQVARDLHGFGWQEIQSAPTAGAVYHIVFSSDEGPGEAAAVSVPSRDGQAVPVGGRRTPSGVERLAAELMPYSAGFEHVRPPRLLILHNVAGEGTAGSRAALDAELVRRGLESGADAVWAVHCGNMDPAYGDVFPMFYRKVLHNWPLDQAILAALAQARSQGREPLGWAFGARSGGEQSLLLSEALVAPTRHAAGKGEVYKSRLPEVLRPSRALGKPPVGRSQRAAADLEAQLAAATAAQTEVLEAQAVRVSSASFSGEEHDLATVLDAQQHVLAAAESVAASREARAALATMPASRVEAGTVRLTQLALSAGSDGEGPKVAADEPLLAEKAYTLHVRIAPHVSEALVAEAFPDVALHTVFQRQQKVVLDVMVFSPHSDFRIAQPRGTLTLPRYGPSNELRTVVTPQRPGQRRLRVCLYYQNTMLQSLWMEGTVVRPGKHAPGATFRATVDYVASADLALLDELPRPALNLFTNETPQGEHWLGVFAAGDLSGFGLRSGDMYTLSNLPTRSKSMRARLREIEDAHRYDEVTLDEQGHLNLDADSLSARQDDLCELARLGRRQFWGMFIGGTASVADVQGLGKQLQTPALISVARCPVDGATFPWAGLYCLDIDTGAPLRLCQVFGDQLAANRWQEGLDGLLHKADLLDQPQRCYGQPVCPLKGDAQRHTVCPFGFWGFVHQIEQPLQQIKPVPSGELPPEITTFSQTSLLAQRPGAPVRLALGVYQDEELQTDAHVQELEGLQKGRRLELSPQKAKRASRNDLIAMMEKGGQQVYYFYCHGEFDEQDNTFMLRVGTADQVGYIAADSLSRVPWKRDEDAPLVVLNGCETVALLPERVHDFLLTLRKLGASGVVGTEIEVYPGLARPFGLQVLRQLLDGISLGEAFLAARLHLLRQYNPLGLAYSFYAPATLHLHDAQSCAWCKTHAAGRTANART